MGKDYNKSSLQDVMREVRVDAVLDKIVSEVAASKMDKSKKVDFAALARMMSESN